MFWGPETPGIRLPWAFGRLQTRNSDGSETEMTNASKTVLVVEDIDSNMKLIHELLEASGYGILKAKNGMDGWHSVNEHDPDLILMDIQLPDVSGLEVTRWLKDDEKLKSIPIIAVTAFAMDGDEQRILDAGCDAYIAKPISIPECLKAIDRLIAKPRNPAESERGAA